jgi:prepilin-type N-terminal cleavage/methylation domain-containing protein
MSLPFTSHACRSRLSGRAPCLRGGSGFTLVELMVVATVIAILATLSAAGLAATRQRVRAEKTRNTIRKLHEIIVGHHESYLRRRVPFTASATDHRANGAAKLEAVRRLMVYEMPDCWADVAASATAVTDTLPAYLQTGPVLGYPGSRPVSIAPALEGAECLYMIVSRGGIEPDLMEQFRSDEIGDTNGNGAPEFLDGWGNPIGFIRWAPGFAGSVLQKPDAVNFHDPFDPQRNDVAGYALVPLIVSAGPDGLVGINLSTGWLSATNLASLVTISPQFTFGTVDGSTASLDNITNHDLVTK